MSALDLQALLRFLAQDAKVPLAAAMPKVKELQTSNLDAPEKIAKVKIDAVQAIFADEKVAKQILAAAKRVTKKREAGDTNVASPAKKVKHDEALFKPKGLLSPEELEASVSLPGCSLGEDELMKVVVHTNRAPLVLAFVVTMLKYSMPEQPLSSQLSLAQAYVSITSRSRAVTLGIESGKSAEEEGFGEGQPTVMIMGKAIRVLKRFGYEWRAAADKQKADQQEQVNTEEDEHERGPEHADGYEEERPPLWALDLEALKKSDSGPHISSSPEFTHSGMPIYTPQSARAYLLKSFNPVDTADTPSQPAKKQSTAAAAVLREENLGKLLESLKLLYDSWAPVLTKEELDGRTWGWYAKVRPDVADGVAGWGGKNQLKLADILALRRKK